MTGSTIAIWLKTCLSEASINTDILKGHSVRDASSSKAVTVGIATADTLQAADWSSVTTFQIFYLRESGDKPSFGRAVFVIF